MSSRTHHVHSSLGASHLRCNAELRATLMFATLGADRDFRAQLQVGWVASDASD